MNNEKLVEKIYSDWQKCQSDLLRIKRNFNKAFEKRCAEINRGFLRTFLSKIPDDDLKEINNILIGIRKIYGSSPLWVNSDEFGLDDDKINDIENKLLEIEKIFYQNGFSEIKDFIIENDNIFNELKESYKNKYQELMTYLKNQDIESKLYTSFKDEKDNVICSRRLYTILFYLVIAIMICTGIFIFNANNELTLSIKNMAENIKNLKPEDFNILFYSNLSKVILFFPLTWLAIFLSKRISEATKIEQTYLHKEVVSKSYVNHLNFITKHYSHENEEIKQSLTSVAISALGLNPALLLEKSTAEKIPMEELLLRIIDNAKLNKPSNKSD